MGTSKPNQIRYNEKISRIRLEIKSEKENFIELVQRDIQDLLERRSPVDMGDLKRSWRVVITNKDKLKGNSLSALTQSRPITLGLSIESSSRHAVMQMFGWKAVPGQLLTGYKKGGKWRILRASRPLFKLFSEPRERKRKDRRKIRSFITRGGSHEPNKNLAFDKGSHSIKSEIKRIIARRLKECKYLGSVVFMNSNIANVSSENTVRGRISKWMAGELNVELNSTATKGLKPKA